jgi:hypothetical protein
VTALRRSGSLTVRRATRSSTWTNTGSDTRIRLVTLLLVTVLKQVVLWMVVVIDGVWPGPGLSPDVGLNAEFLRVAALYYCPEHKQRAGW